VKVETYKQSKQWINQTSRKSLNKRLPARKLIDGNYFLEQERSVDGGIHATRDHSDLRSLLRKTKKIVA
jgi:hypothetical protein